MQGFSMPTTNVIPAQAGIRARLLFEFHCGTGRIPAFAGMTADIADAEHAFEAYTIYTNTGN